jgi:potassium-transporting ATPase KdpC subunit
MREIRPALLIFLVLTLITGIAYPLVVTAIAKVMFPSQAAGSLIQDGDKIIGSALVGQSFSDPKYFWSRPSATSPQPYNAASSSGSNQGPTNPALSDAVKGRIEALHSADPGAKATVPVDLVTASGSGLDPHISPAAAEYQVIRIAHARGLPEATVRQLVAEYTEGRQLGVLGEPRVNVLLLNLALDKGKQPKIEE